MNIRFYNTLSKRIETFEPIEPGVVHMYNCGPTVYDFAHIGNFRTFCFADLLRRMFEFCGYRVVQVMNLTDVGHMTDDSIADGGGEDKMQVAMRRLKEDKKQGVAPVDDPDDPYQIAAYFADAFLQDARLLGLKVADESPQQTPKATEHIDGMIELIEKLIEAGHAYIGGDGVVYYDVRSFADYGQLSGNTLDRLVSGAGGRLSDDHVAHKRHPADFFLRKPDPAHIMKWPSPWGVGYPGWHIECSTMAMCLHGQPTIDMHTGAEDNIFPHHECEIAQSTGATGRPFARYWLHARFLLVEGEKMSKSKGNFYTLRDLLAKGADPAAVRYALITAPYQRNANFTFKGLADADRQVRRLRSFIAAHPDVPAASSPQMGDTAVERAFAEALADDLNISAALGELSTWLHSTSNPTVEDVATLKRIDQVLGVLEPRAAGVAVEPTGLADDQIQAMCRQIDEARAAKDYAESDRLRDELAEAGIEVQTTRDGTTWRRKMQLNG